MIIVNEEILESFTEVAKIRINSALREHDESVDLVESLRDEAHVRIFQERSSNPELDKFWYQVDVEEAEMRSEGADTSEILLTFLPLYALQDIYSRQDKLNKNIVGVDIPDQPPLE